MTGHGCGMARLSHVDRHVTSRRRTVPGSFRQLPPRPLRSPSHRPLSSSRGPPRDINPYRPGEQPGGGQDSVGPPGQLVMRLRTLAPRCDRTSVSHDDQARTRNVGRRSTQSAKRLSTHDMTGGARTWLAGHHGRTGRRAAPVPGPPRRRGRQASAPQRCPHRSRTTGHAAPGKTCHQLVIAAMRETGAPSVVNRAHHRCAAIRPTAGWHQQERVGEHTRAERRPS